MNRNTASIFRRDEDEPPFKLSIKVPAGWSDTTYHNDMCPSIENLEGTLRLWVDEPDSYWQKQEGFEDASRFCLVRKNADGNCEETSIYEGDSLGEALRVATNMKTSSTRSRTMRPKTARMKIKEVEGPHGKAVVYKDREWGEIIVVLNHDEKNAYRTDNKQDALDTAETMSGNRKVAAQKMGSRKKIKDVKGPKGSVVIYYDNDWSEYIAIPNQSESASYHTDDLQDAIQTAEHMAMGNMPCKYSDEGCEAHSIDTHGYCKECAPVAVSTPGKCDYCGSTIPADATECLKENVCPSCVGELKGGYSGDEGYHGINSNPDHYASAEDKQATRYPDKGFFSVPDVLFKGVFVDLDGTFEKDGAGYTVKVKVMDKTLEAWELRLVDAKRAIKEKVYQTMKENGWDVAPQYGFGEHTASSKAARLGLKLALESKEAAIRYMRSLVAKPAAKKAGREYIFRPYFHNGSTWEAAHGTEWTNLSRSQGFKDGKHMFEQDGLQEGEQVMIAALRKDTDDYHNAVETRCFVCRGGLLLEGFMGRDSRGRECVEIV